LKNVIPDKFDALVTSEAYLIDSTGVLRYHGRIDDSPRVANVKQHDLQNVLDAYLAGGPLPERESRALGCTIKRVDQRAAEVNLSAEISCSHGHLTK